MGCTEMKVLVTGVAGQLGHDVMEELKRRGHEAIGSDVAVAKSGAGNRKTTRDASSVLLQDAYADTSYMPLDITDAAAVRQVLTEIRPDAVIHCAAWTAVDAAEEPTNFATVQAVNVDGTRHIANACRDLGCKMLYLSTDYVFDGQGTEPLQPDCKDFRPLNVYGQSKLDGEFAVADALERFFIVRIAWVFGTNGSNFIKTMLQVGKTHEELRVVDDQIGTPTYTYDLARLLVDMIETERYGYYHATNEGGYISWYEFAKEIFRQAAELGYTEYDEAHLTVTSVTTAEYGVSKAVRPFNSRLDKSKLVACGFAPLPDWRDALHRFLLSGEAFPEE